MSKTLRTGFENIKQGKGGYKLSAYSHTGNKPLVPSLADPNIMVTQKVRAAQERNKNRRGK